MPFSVCKGGGGIRAGFAFVRRLRWLTIRRTCYPICASFLHLDEVKYLCKEGKLNGVLDLITDPECFSRLSDQGLYNIVQTPILQ